MTLVENTVVDQAFADRAFRIALATRKFWPVFGPSEMAVADLASEFQAMGCQPEVVTVRWERNWPAHFSFNEFPVHRVNRGSSAPWGSIRYVRNLHREIDDLQVDAIVVFGLHDESWAVAKSFAGKIPYVIRLDHLDLGLRDEKPNLSSRQIQAIKMAECVWVESEWTKNRLLKHPALDPQQIRVVPTGIQINPAVKRTPTRQATSRVAISDAHPVLAIDAVQPLVVCASPMNGDRGLIDLVNAWEIVLSYRPKARLWILGEGIRSREVWDAIVRSNLVHSIVMPGSFDHLEMVFQAADFYVHPLRSNQSCSNLVRAMAAGLCPVATQTTATAGLVKADHNGDTVAAGDARCLAETMLHIINRMDLRERMGRAAAESVQKFSVGDSARKILNSLGYPVWLKHLH